MIWMVIRIIMLFPSINYAQEPLDIQKYSYSTQFNKCNITYIDDSAKKFFNAITSNNILIISEMLHSGFNLDIRDSNYKTPLMYISDDSLEIASLLLKYNASINAQDALGNTALMQASEKGNTKFVEWLIKNNAIINIENKEELTALHFAVQNGHKEITEALINNFANIHITYPNQQSLLMMATKMGHHNIVDLLLKEGLNPNETIASSGTPLITIASILGYSNIIQSLITNGADINKTNNYGVSPLLSSLLAKNYNSMKILLDHNADLETLSISNKSWLDLYAKPDKFVKNLLQKYKNKKVKKS